MVANDVNELKAALEKNQWVFAWLDENDNVNFVSAVDWEGAPESEGSPETTVAMAVGSPPKCKNFPMPNGTIITVCF